MTKQARVSDGAHQFITQVALAEGRTFAKQLDKILEEVAPRVSKRTMNRTRKSIGGVR